MACPFKNVVLARALDYERGHSTKALNITSGHQPDNWKIDNEFRVAKTSGRLGRTLLRWAAAKGHKDILSSCFRCAAIKVREHRDIPQPTTSEAGENEDNLGRDTHIFRTDTP